MARRCGYCYGRGHNKRTCPDITENYIRRYNADAHGETKEAWAQEVRKRGVNPDTGKALTAKEKTARTGYAKQPRRCTYCDEGGHNSATCTTKKTDINLVNEVAKEFRIAVVDRLKNGGYPCKGTLLQYHSPREWMGSRAGYVAVNEIHMVAGVDWTRVNFGRAFGGATDWLKLINLAAPGSPRHVSQQAHWRVDKLLRNTQGRVGNEGWAGLSNPPTTSFDDPPPAWWCLDEAGVENVCRLVVKGLRRNVVAMRIFTAALAACKDGRDIDMAEPRTWTYQLDNLGLQYI
jgi:hypothetical protein